MNHNISLQNMLSELLKHYTQHQLQVLTGVDQGSISKMKNGKFKYLSFQKADAIRNFYFSWINKKAPVAENN
ncbi:hypothetical protein [uncultured Acinetobacter sp.]|uniref:hypothetical protein n=1 Tax=uncultured Acinetobacter sp. TaxID=165433 RepID=UPI0037482B26